MILLEMVRDYRVKENTKVKYYSDFEMYRKMFFMNLNKISDEAEEELKNGNVLDFNEVIIRLNKKFGFEIEPI